MVHQVDPQLLLEIAAIWPPEMPQYRRGYLLKALKRRFEPDNPCFLMRAGGKLCGAVWLTQPSATIRSVLTGLPSKVVMISNLFIAAQKRGPGFGRALLHAAVAYAWASGVEQVVSVIEPSRQASIKVHQSVGFRFKGMLIETTRFFRTKVSFHPSHDGAEAQRVFGQRL
jgi:GNAT superfamily N-acetyltransferase